MNQWLSDLDEKGFERLVEYKEREEANGQKDALPPEKLSVADSPGFPAFYYPMKCLEEPPILRYSASRRDRSGKKSS